MRVAGKSLVYGVGINDYKGLISKTQNVDGKNKVVWRCVVYNTWVHMLARCYSEDYLIKRPKYGGCSVVEDWLRFSMFRSWCMLQDYEGKHLDKDILVPNNKIYGPDTCVFVPHYINTFISDREALRGLYPIGVGWHKEKQKYFAQCSDPFTKKRGFLGYFLTQEDAHNAWLKRKHELACIYADLLQDSRVGEALKNLYQPKN